MTGTQTVLDLIKSSLRLIGQLGPGQGAGTSELADALLILNGMLDSWNVEKASVYAILFTNFTLTPSLSPHTIGPTGATFTATERPVRIEGANLILNTSTPNVYQPIALRDKDWWLNQRVPTLTSGIPTDLYYSADWPNGRLFFWPVPTVAYGVRLETWGVLTGFATTGTAFSMPPGYFDAVRYNLALRLAPEWRKSVPPEVERMARKTKAAIYAMNTSAPRIPTRDAGVPGSGGNRSNWNWHTGQTR